MHSRRLPVKVLSYSQTPAGNGRSITVTLNEVEVGTRVRIRGYRDQSEYVLKLQRLGLVPGTELELLRKAPLGDPVEIRVRGFSLALRPSEASGLELEELGS